MEPLIAIYSAAEIFLALFISFSNLLVIWVFVKVRRIRSPTNTYIFSLALTDFLTGAIGIPVTVYSVVSRAPHAFLPCLALHIILCMFCTISLFHLLAIAIDKYLSICCHCGLLHQRSKHGRARFLIVLAWVFGSGIACLPLFDAFGFASSTSGNFIGECHFTVVMDYRYLVYVIFFGTIIIPSLIIIFCYVSIFHKIKLEERHVKCLLRVAERQKRIMKRRKLLRIMIILVTTYAVTWYPLYIINTIDLFFPEYHSTAAITLAAVVLSHVSCAVNPLIYAYGVPGFQHALRQFFRIGPKSETTAFPSCVVPQSKTFDVHSQLYRDVSMIRKESAHFSRNASMKLPQRAYTFE
uniref:G-protein coupled receptors family 1 profile domain-containing protein n=1 Tax=Acrobeloides nanus TaxID=290746 RepID=A0A914CNB4_9BILA